MSEPSARVDRRVVKGPSDVRIDRRAVLRGIAAGAAGLSLAGIARLGRAADGGLAATTLAPGVTVLAGAGGNIVVLATDAGKVVVDGGAAAFGSKVRQALDGLPGGNV